MRLDEAIKLPEIANSTYADVLDGHINWARRDHMVYGLSHDYGSNLIQMDERDGVLILNAAPVVGKHRYTRSRNLINTILPNPLRITSTKEDRWVVTGHDNARSVPFHNNIEFGNNLYIKNADWTRGYGSWRVVQPLPYPDKAHIPQPIQHLVKKWAGSYRPDHHLGVCGMCTHDPEANRMTAVTLDGGRHERQHLLDHILTGRLPSAFMQGILHEARQPPTYITPGDVAPFRQACYQVAVWYAYRVLRSTYA